ncbi:MFS transporter [Piscirickettsia litoralis]|uniref:hypothetical protein n=1 Tax=Piscirickettsia litoralis TaxID=1891921 RepID=UPI000980C9A9|nr:hypothetical protein [Piscirickettsia litoralis]
MISACLIGITNAFIFCFYAEGPFIFINHVKLSSQEYGLLGIFIAVASIFGGFAYRHLQKGLEDKTIAYLGGLMSFIGSGLMLFGLIVLNSVGAEKHVIISIIVIMLPFMLISFGSFGLVVPVVLSQALVKYQDCLGTAGALFGLLYYMVLSVLTWTMGLIHNKTLWPMPSYFFVLSFVMLLMFKASSRKSKTDLYDFQ